MQINKPPSPGTPTTGSSIGSPAADKANRADNPLAQLVGQVISAQVLQSKAVQVATIHANTLQAGVAARLLQDQGSEKAPNVSTTPAPASSATGSSATGSATAASSTTPTASTYAPSTYAPSTTAPASATGATPPTQTQYQTTLQIGNERVVVVTDQPLQPGAQLQLKVSAPQTLQLLQQPTATPPPVAPDVTGNLLNTLLRQALPLQQPVVNLLASIADRLLPSTTNPTAGTGNTSNPLAGSNLTLPPTLTPALATALKPLLSQIVNSQLTLETITEPGALRNALANSGLFREARLLQWAQALLKQFPELATRGSGAAGAPLIPTAAAAGTTSAGFAQTAASMLASQAGIAAGNTVGGSTTPNAAGVQPGTTNATPLASSDDLLDAKQMEVLNKATVASGNASQQALQTASGNEAGTTDVDALRNDLLKALSERAQKNQPAFTGSAGNPAVSTESAKNAAAMPPSGTGIGTSPNPLAANALPVNAKGAAAMAPPLATGVAADTKTTLERLVSVTAQQFLTRAGAPTTDSISEEHVMAILRQLPLAQMPELQAAASKAKPKDDDSQWIMQLLRGSFGALKHLQLQQATNLGASPVAQQGNDSPVPPLQIEMPILIAQQWQNVHIEIDRRTPESKSEGAQKERSWRVTLRFELPQQGIIVAQLNLAGTNVNATLWAEKQATCQQLQQQLKDLSDRLGKVGANVTTLDVRHGQPPSAKSRIEQRLIDIRT